MRAALLALVNSPSCHLLHLFVLRSIFAELLHCLAQNLLFTEVSSARTRSVLKDRASPNSKFLLYCQCPRCDGCRENWEERERTFIAYDEDAAQKEVDLELASNGTCQLVQFRDQRLTCIILMVPRRGSEPSTSQINVPQSQNVEMSS